jgi:hypothetical protein
VRRGSSNDEVRILETNPKLEFPNGSSSPEFLEIRSSTFELDSRIRASTFGCRGVVSRDSAQKYNSRSQRRGGGEEYTQLSELRHNLDHACAKHERSLTGKAHITGCSAALRPMVRGFGELPLHRPDAREFFAHFTSLKMILINQRDTRSFGAAFAVRA